MYLAEIYDQIPELYHSEKDDNTTLKLRDLRKTRLTLAHINKLRMATDIRKFEKEEQIKNVSDQYKPPAAEAGVMPAL
jgi:hypothetical protein